MMDVIRSAAANSVAWMRRFFHRNKWPAPARDRDHEVYREQYDGLVPGLAALPNGDHTETRQAYMFKAEIEIGLHNYGDHPFLLTPRAALPNAGEDVSRGTVQGFLTPLATANPLLGVLTSPAFLMAACFAVPAAWGSVQTARLHHAKSDLEEAARTAAINLRAAHEWQAQFEQAHADVIEAAQQTLQTTETIEHERRIRIAAQRENQRIRNAYHQADIGGPPDYGFGSVRPPEPDAGAGANPGAADADNPGGVRT